MPDFKFDCPHCGQSLEAPEELLGDQINCPTCNGAIQLPRLQPTPPAAPPTSAKKQMATPPPKTPGDTRPCPHCGEAILRTAQKCRCCGEFLKGERDITTNVKQGALIGAVACFVIGLVMMFFSLWTFIMYVPLFLAAFVLSIVAMAQKRVAGGIAMMLLTIILPPVLFFGLGATRTRKALDEVAKSLEQGNAAPVKHTGRSTTERTLALGNDADRILRIVAQYQDSIQTRLAGGATSIQREDAIRSADQDFTTEVETIESATLYFRLRDVTEVNDTRYPSRRKIILESPEQVPILSVNELAVEGNQTELMNLKRGDAVCLRGKIAYFQGGALGGFADWGNNPTLFTRGRAQNSCVYWTVNAPGEVMNRHIISMPKSGATLQIGTTTWSVLQN